MWRLSPKLRACICLVALAMFGLQLGGMHLHLCFDGQEPPATLHAQHVMPDQDDHHGSDSSHRDQDVEVQAPGYVKKDASDVLDALAVAWVLAAIIPVEQRLVPDIDAPLRPSGSPHFLRPPLRGPPA